MKKLVIQIPCYNEEQTLGVALAALPRTVPGIDKVEWLVVDDGSTDRTVEVAREHGVDHVVRLPKNQGLARGFMAGLAASLRAGADIIVNTDADNQYCADDIPALIQPILDGEAEIVVGARPIPDIAHFSPVKKRLQRFGSWVVRVASNTDVPDAPSGFRAMSRDAAMRLNVFNQYTYTLETIIQAGQKNMAITSVPVRVNEDLRPSRLVKSIPSYVKRSILTIFRIFVTYQPFKSFAWPGVICVGVGLAIGLRFAWFYLIGNGAGHVQSLILAALLLGTGFFLLVMGMMAELVGVNRTLLEDLRWQIMSLRHLSGRPRTDAQVHDIERRTEEEDDNPQE